MKKQNYKFSTTSEKWVMEPGSFARYIGMPVLLITHKKTPDGKWDVTDSTVLINSVGDFEPIMESQLIRYTTSDNEIKEERVNPIGMTVGNPEELSEILRFVPLKVHYRLQEELAFVSRIKKMWEENKSVPTQAIQQLSESKDQISILRSQYIVAVYKKGEELSYFRIKKLSLRHVVKSKYNLNITAEDGNNFVYSANSVDGKLTISEDNELGELKLIDVKVC